VNDFPRDRWLVSENPEGSRHYIVHAAAPRFVARVVACDPDGQPYPDEEPVAAEAGITYSPDGDIALEPDPLDPELDEEIVRFLYCEMAWQEPPPEGEQRERLFAEMHEAFVQHLLAQIDTEGEA
jgi:hypothetical protein